MNLDRTLVLTSVLVLISTVACHHSSTDSASSEKPAAPTQQSMPAAVPSAPSVDEPAGVSYEPAYPADVGAEGLDAEDAAQQETHAHGDAEHTHGEDTHGHDEEGSGGEDDH